MRSSVSARAISPSTSSTYGNSASATARDRSRTSARTAPPLRENSRAIAEPFRPAAPVIRIMQTSTATDFVRCHEGGTANGSAHARFALNKEGGKMELAPGVERLIRSLAVQRCRERGHLRVFGLKEPVGRKVLHLVLVE